MTPTQGPPWRIANIELPMKLLPKIPAENRRYHFHQLRTAQGLRTGPISVDLYLTSEEALHAEGTGELSRLFAADFDALNLKRSLQAAP